MVNKHITSFLSLLSVYGFGIGAVAKGKAWFGNDSAKRLDWRPEDPVSAISYMFLLMHRLSLYQTAFLNYFRDGDFI